MGLAVAYWCVVVVVLLPYVWAVVAKRSVPGYNNRNPRAWIAKQDNYGVQRAYAAHHNAFEAIAPFVTGVVLAQLAGVPADRIALLAVAFTVLRVLHGLLYVGDKPTLRSVIWGLGFACVLALLVQAALRMG